MGRKGKRNQVSKGERDSVNEICKSYASCYMQSDARTANQVKAACA